MNFSLSQNCTFNFKQGHYKITFVSMRIRATKKESTCLKKNPLVKLFFSKELSFLRNNINFPTNLSADQTDLQFQIPNLE